MIPRKLIKLDKYREENNTLTNIAHLDFPTRKYKIRRSCDLLLNEKISIIHDVIVNTNNYKEIA